MRAGWWVVLLALAPGQALAGAEITGRVLVVGGTPSTPIEVRVQRLGLYDHQGDLCQLRGTAFTCQVSKPGKLHLYVGNPTQARSLSSTVFVDRAVEVEVAPGERKDVGEIRLLRNGGLQGKVEGSREFRLQVTSRGQVEKPYTQVLPVTDGTFRLDEVPPGSYQVKAFLPSGRVLRQEVEVTGGKQAEVTFRQQGPEGHLALSFKDEHGTVLDGATATVEVNGQKVPCRATDRGCSADDVPPGKVQVTTDYLVANEKGDPLVVDLELAPGQDLTREVQGVALATVIRAYLPQLPEASRASYLRVLERAASLRTRNAHLKELEGMNRTNRVNALNTDMRTWKDLKRQLKLK